MCSSSLDCLHKGRSLPRLLVKWNKGGNVFRAIEVISLSSRNWISRLITRVSRRKRSPNLCHQVQPKTRSMVSCRASSLNSTAMRSAKTDFPFSSLGKPRSGKISGGGRKKKESTDGMGMERMKTNCTRWLPGSERFVARRSARKFSVDFTGFWSFTAKINFDFTTIPSPPLLRLAIVSIIKPSEPLEFLSAARET